MRYFVYKDSQILGPFSPEEFHQAGSLHPDALVCEESLSGRRDSDWRTVGDIPELSEVRVLEPSYFDEALPGSQSGVLERMELESLGLPGHDEDGENWIRSLFEDPDFRLRFGGLLPKVEDNPQQLSFAKNRIAELTGEVEALKARLAELEKQEHDHWRDEELPRVLGEGLSLPPMQLPAVEPPVYEPPPPLPPRAAPEVKEEAPAPPQFQTSEPPQAPEAVPAITLRFDAPAEKIEEPAAPIAPQAQAPEAAAPLFKLRISEAHVLPPADEAVVPAQEEQPAQLPVLEPPQPEPAADLSPSAGRDFDWKDGPVVKNAPAPVSAEEDLVPPGVRPIELPPIAVGAFEETPPASVAGQESPAQTPPQASLEMAPISLEPPSIVEPPQSLEVSVDMPTLQPVPAPTLATEAAVPLTAVFGPGTQAESSPAEPAFSAPAFPPVPTDLGTGYSLGPAPAQTPAVDVVARLAKPEPAPATATKPARRVSRVGLVVVVIFTIASAAFFFMFLRNPKDLKSMVNMGADQKPLGAETPEDGVKPFSPKPGQTPQPEAPAAAPQTTASQSPAPIAPAAQPAPATPSSSAPSQALEGSEGAIALVKNYPLDGDRGTVGQFLQYSFAANPGDKEEWTAGAVDETTYLVQYQVHPGPGDTVTQSISYVFEADIQRKTVKGNNPASRQLMAGGEPVTPKKSAAVRKTKRIARRSRPKRTPIRRASKSESSPEKPVSLLPLPTDAELLPSAEDDATFQDATVLQEPGQ